MILIDEEEQASRVWEWRFVPFSRRVSFRSFKGYLGSWAVILAMEGSDESVNG